MARTTTIGAAALILTSISSPTPSLADCVERIHDGTPYAAHAMPSHRRGCIVRSARNDSGTDAYRTFTFGELDGEFQVFNSYAGGGTLSDTTGFRSYFLFPRLRTPGFEVLENGNYLFRSASRLELEISRATGRVVRATGATFEESRSVARDNGGGFTIGGYDGIVLDTGFYAASPGFHHPSRDSVFRDSAGHRCEVENREIFDYTYFADGSLDDAAFKFVTDEELRAFLASNCRRLDLSSLSPTPEEAAAGSADETAGAAGGVPGGAGSVTIQSDRRSGASETGTEGRGDAAPELEVTVEPGH